MTMKNYESANMKISPFQFFLSTAMIKINRIGFLSLFYFHHSVVVFAQKNCIFGGLEWITMHWQVGTNAICCYQKMHLYLAWDVRKQTHLHHFFCSSFSLVFLLLPNEQFNRECEMHFSTMLHTHTGNIVRLWKFWTKKCKKLNWAVKEVLVVWFISN